jgi:hypothetical protein
LDARHPRHRHVQDHELDVLRESLLDGGGPILGFRDDREVGFGVEDAAQPCADDRMVVGDEDARDERNRRQS